MKHLMKLSGYVTGQIRNTTFIYFPIEEQLFITKLSGKKSLFPVHIDRFFLLDTPTFALGGIFGIHSLDFYYSLKICSLKSIIIYIQK